jgi:RNA polymerase sigma factor for flagellar operon FliA
VKEILMGAIERLPEKQRLVIVLYYYEELTFKEIGSLLKVSESRVSQIHSEVLSKLKQGIRI